MFASVWGNVSASVGGNVSSSVGGMVFASVAANVYVSFGGSRKSASTRGSESASVGEW